MAKYLNRVYGNFDISGNVKFSSPDGVPKIVSGNFNMYYTKGIYHIKDGPHDIGGNFRAYGSELRSLEGVKYVGGNIWISGSKINTFKGFPSVLNGNLWATEMPISSLDYFPKEVKGEILFESYTTIAITKEDILKICKVDPEKVFVL